MSETCKYVYVGDHDWCCMPAAPDSEFCVWHNPELSKADNYVAELLAAIMRFADRDLTEYHLAELDWPHAQLSRVTLDGADLRDAHLPYAQLKQASLINASLRRCNLRKANLFGADLRGCDLKHTDLNGADLREANLSGAQFSDTNLLNANLSGANLSNINVQSFRWNDATDFSAVLGLDPQNSDSDETQSFITPIALAAHQKGKSHSSGLTRKSTILQTHEYRSSSNAVHTLDSLEKVADALKTELVEKRPSSQELPRSAAPQLAAQIADFVPYKKRIRLLSIACAAALFLMLAASAFGVFALRALQQRPTIEKEVVVTKKVYIDNPDMSKPVPASESKMYKQLSKQYADLVAQHKSLSESYRQFDRKVQTLEDHTIEQKNTIVRLQLRNDELEHNADQLKSLQQQYHSLRRHADRLNDTASILADGVDTLSSENEKLSAIKSTRLNTQAQLDLLQSKTLQLQIDNDQLKKDNEKTNAYNQSLLAELGNARQSLERFLARIEGSRLQAFLTKDTDHITAIAVQAGKPIVLTGDQLITLELNKAQQPDAASSSKIASSNFNNSSNNNLNNVLPPAFIQSKLFIQRSAQEQIPDVNIIFYNAQMKPLRSVSYGFPNVDSKESFAVSSATFNVPEFPSFVRILVNPGIEDELSGSQTLSQLP